MTAKQWLAMTEGHPRRTEAEWQTMNYDTLVMTEAGWAACQSPAVRLRYVWFKITDRKKQLYICGGCSRMKHLFYDPSLLNYLEVAERYADGLADHEEIRTADYFVDGFVYGSQYEQDFWERVTVGKEAGLAQLVAAGILDGAALTTGEWILDRELVEQLERYCQYLESDRDYVVAQALDIAFKKDRGFADWLKTQPALEPGGIPDTGADPGRLSAWTHLQPYPRHLPACGERNSFRGKIAAIPQPLSSRPYKECLLR